MTTTFEEKVLRAKARHKHGLFEKATVSESTPNAASKVNFSCIKHPYVKFSAVDINDYYNLSSKGRNPNYAGTRRCCPVCNLDTETLENVHKMLAEVEHIQSINKVEYHQKNIEILYLCTCGFEHTTSFKKALNGNTCPMCGIGKKTISQQLARLEFYDKKIEILNPETYTNNATTLDAKCLVCFHEWTGFRFQNIHRRGCPSCGDTNKNGRYSFKSFEDGSLNPNADTHFYQLTFTDETNGYKLYKVGIDSSHDLKRWGNTYKGWKIERKNIPMKLYSAFLREQFIKQYYAKYLINAQHPHFEDFNNNGHTEIFTSQEIHCS